jgi:hypothetical protein
MVEPNVLRPTITTRLISRLRGEIAAHTVEAYRQASHAVYHDLMAAERLRDRLAGCGISLWDAEPGHRSQLLCTWNAHALHTLGDQLVEADYRADRYTVGYLPPVTARQAIMFFDEVEHWSGQARRAAHDQNYDVGKHLSLPASLPEWQDPCPPAHFDAALAAARILRDHAQGALADYTRAGVPPPRRGLTGTLDGLLAEADAAVSFVEILWTPHTPDAVALRALSLVRRALARYYLVGQLLAMPVLLERHPVRPAPGPAGPEGDRGHV